MRKAESDYGVVRKLLGNKCFRDAVCFHSQQLSEKYLKALLRENGLPAPKIHNLATLVTMLSPVDPTLRQLRRGLKKLSSYAVETRYPGLDPSARDTRLAVEKAKRFRLEIRKRLGLPNR